MSSELFAISGSSGFIGSSLVKYLKRRSKKVYRIERDLLYDPQRLQDTLKTVQPTHIIHCAAYGNMHHHTNPALIHSSIVDTLKNLLAATLNLPYLGLVTLGSSSEYGKQKFEMSEEDVCMPTTIYAKSKLEATQYAQAYAYMTKKPVTVLRPFSVYGVGEAEYRFIPTICRSLLTGQPLTIDPEATHDWIDVYDMVDAILQAVQHPQPGEVFNVGTGEATSNMDVVNILRRISGKTVILKPQAMRPDDPRFWEANMSKFNSHYHLKPLSLEKGLARVYRYALQAHTRH